MRDDSRPQMIARIALILAISFVTLACAGCVGGGTREAVPELEVPFEFVRNQILVPVRIRGYGPYFCTVDTGANPSAIDARLANELGLPVREEAAPAEGVGAAEVLVRQTEFDVALEGGRSSTISAVAMDLSTLSAAFGRRLHCVLGQSWLGTRVAQVDYPALRLRLSSSSLADPKGWVCVRTPMTFWMPDDLMPLVVVEVNGTAIPVSLDTGSSGTLKLFPEGARAAGIPTSGDDLSRNSVVGARGSAEVKRVTFASLRFGPISVKDVKGSIGDKILDEPEGRLGNVGNGLLQFGVATLNFPARRISICAPRSLSE